MTDAELISSFIASNGVRRVPKGRKTYARRAIVALAEGSDIKLAEFRADQQLGFVNQYGRRVRRSK